MEHVRNVNRPTLQHGSPGNRAASWRDWVVFDELPVLLGKPMRGAQVKDIALTTENERVFRLAQPCRRSDERIEHGLQIEGRTADDLEHVGGRGLLLERFR